MSQVERIVAEALEWIGTPYRHQGRRKGLGCDCLGLVLGVWHAVCGSAPAAPDRYAPDWSVSGGGEMFLEAVRKHCVEKRPAEMAPGDLLLFRWRNSLRAGHAGILVAPGQFVHAYQRGFVSRSPLQPWRRRLAGVFAFPKS